MKTIITTMENWTSLEFDIEKPLQTFQEEIPWYIGIVVCGIFGFKLLISLYPLMSRRKFVWIVDGGKWAVVTGATDGMGYEYAVQLAEKGYNLMLLSRNKEKLQRIKQKIHNNLEINNIKIQIETMAVDFSKLDIYDQIKKFLCVNNRDIFVLVNNVGIAVPYPDTFLNLMEIDPELCQRMINVNVVSATKMTEMILPSMVSKKSGLILNVASSSAFFPIPLLAVYSATKAYIRHLSIALAEECRTHNVYVYCLTSGWVKTNMTNHIKRIDGIDAQTYVKSALNSVQNMNYFESHGYWIHRISHYLSLTVKFLISDQLFYRLAYWAVSSMKERMKNRCTR